MANDLSCIKKHLQDGCRKFEDYIKGGESRGSEVRSQEVMEDKFFVSFFIFETCVQRQAFSF